MRYNIFRKTKQISQKQTRIHNQIKPRPTSIINRPKIPQNTDFLDPGHISLQKKAVHDGSTFAMTPNFAMASESIGLSRHWLLKARMNCPFVAPTFAAGSTFATDLDIAMWPTLATCNGSKHSQYSKKLQIQNKFK